MNVTTLRSDDLAAWARRLRWQEEILTRTLDLFRPRDEDQYLSTLRWIVACGGERDINLIKEASRVGKYQSEEADALIREAPSRIRAREARKSRAAEHERTSSPETAYFGPFAEVVDEAAALVNGIKSMSPKQLDQCLPLSAAAETIARRIELVKPRTETEFRQALYWASARGEAVDLELVEAVEGLRRFRSVELDRLIAQVKQSISHRIRARELLREMLKANTADKINVADDVLRFGFSSRGTGAPRGDVLRSAEARVPSNDLESVTRLLESSNLELRQQVALVLGEWGGEQEAAALANALRREGWKSRDGEQFALHCVSALKSIGGSRAVHALCDALENGTVPIQLAALNAIEDLATGGSEIYGEGVPHFDPPKGRYFRGELAAPGTEQVVKTLEKTLHKADSPAVRARSKELLEHVLT